MNKIEKNIQIIQNEQIKQIEPNIQMNQNKQKSPSEQNLKMNQISKINKENNDNMIPD